MWFTCGFSTNNDNTIGKMSFGWTSKCENAHNTSSNLMSERERSIDNDRSSRSAHGLQRKARIIILRRKNNIRPLISPSHSFLISPEVYKVYASPIGLHHPLDHLDNMNINIWMILFNPIGTDSCRDTISVAFIDDNITPDNYQHQI